MAPCTSSTFPTAATSRAFKLAPAASPSASFRDFLAVAVQGSWRAINVDKLKNAAPILKAAADDKKIRVVGGVYELKTGKVRLVA
jgi:carbonic anhydrase